MRKLVLEAEFLPVILFIVFICNLFFYFHSRAATQGMMEGYSSSTGSSFILFRKQKSAWGLFIFAFLGYVIAGTKNSLSCLRSRNAINNLSDEILCGQWLANLANPMWLQASLSATLFWRIN